MRRSNILIADDEEEIRDLFAEVLEDDDYHLFLTSNGDEAVEIARSNPIDLAILDLVMPGMDGIEALRRIKEIDNTIEVLIMTGYADLGDVEKTIIDHQAIDYLPKPFDLMETRRIIGRALQKRRLISGDSHVVEELRNRILELETDFREKTLLLRKSQIKYENIIEGSDFVLFKIGFVS